MAISGMDEVKSSHPGVRSIRAAMEECLDCGTELTFSSKSEAESTDLPRLHQQWGAGLGGEDVASFPLKLADETVAIVRPWKHPSKVMIR